MTKPDKNKLEITYKEKKYEIEPKKEEQKVKPKGGKDTDAELTVKNYEEGGCFTSHKCECSEDGTTFEKIDIKWGSKKHITIWSLAIITVVLFGISVWYFGFRDQDKEKDSL